MAAEFTARIAYEWVRRYYREVGRLEIPPFRPRMATTRTTEFMVFKFVVDKRRITVTVTAAGDITPQVDPTINEVNLGGVRSLTDEVDNAHDPFPPWIE